MEGCSSRISLSSAVLSSLLKRGRKVKKVSSSRISYSFLCSSFLKFEA
jgi:hypothetical protein